MQLAQAAAAPAATAAASPVTAARSVNVVVVILVGAGICAGSGSGEEHTQLCCRCSPIALFGIAILYLFARFPVSPYVSNFTHEIPEMLSYFRLMIY